jgi:hypothetical protein
VKSPIETPQEEHSRSSRSKSGRITSFLELGTLFVPGPNPKRHSKINKIEEKVGEIVLNMDIVREAVRGHPFSE